MLTNRNRTPNQGEAIEPERLICDTPEQINLAVEFCMDSDLIAKDVETIPHIKMSKRAQKDKERFIPFVMTVDSITAIAGDEMRSFAFQLTSRKSPDAEPARCLVEKLEAMRVINASDVRKTLHNGVYDAAWYMRYGVPLNAYAYDSMTMWWARYPDLPKSLDFVSSILLDDHAYWKMGRKDNDFLAHTVYAMRDTETTLRNTLKLIHWMMDDSDMRRNFLMAHMRCLSGLGMSMKGAPIDQTMRLEMHEELKLKAAEKMSVFKNLVGDEDANPQSPKQMIELFYGILGASPRNAKGKEIKRVTATNKPSTGKVALRSIENDHPILKRIVTAYNEAKEPSKQISNVIGIEFPDDRFRTSYDGVGTTTSRFASRSDAFGFGGNAQNIRKKFRRMVRAELGHFFLEVDFSAADDVFVSYESEEPRKIALVESGKDTHSFNASEVFFTNWDYDEVVSGKKAGDPRVIDPIVGIRQITKKVTHGANYLMAGMTLLAGAGRDAIVAAAMALGYEEAPTWSMRRLGEFCNFLDEKYRRYYPRFVRTGSDSFYTDLHRELLISGSFLTCFNYRQRFSNDPNDQSTLRAVAATVGQANTAGRVNMAIDELVHGVRIKRFRDGLAPDIDDRTRMVSEESHGASLRFQTHDSVTYDIDPAHPKWREGVADIFHVLKRPVLCKGRLVRVGIEGDCAIHWAHNAKGTDTVEEVESWVNSFLPQPPIAVSSQSL